MAGRKKSLRPHRHAEGRSPFQAGRGAKYLRHRRRVLSGFSIATSGYPAEFVHMSVTLAQLRAFVSVAQHNGFTAASRALGVSQSTISSQIQQLEQEYGVELFRRRGKRVDLSSIGMELLPLARQMAALESDTHTLLCDSGALRRGVLKIGAVGQYHITDMIEAYYAVHPLIRLNVTLGNSEVVLNDLDDYTCDVGIVASRHPDERYYMQSYASYPVIVFVNASHRFATRSSVALSELAGGAGVVGGPGGRARRGACMVRVWPTQGAPSTPWRHLRCDGGSRARRGSAVQRPGDQAARRLSPRRDGDGSDRPSTPTPAVRQRRYSDSPPRPRCRCARARIRADRRCSR